MYHFQIFFNINENGLKMLLAEIPSQTFYVSIYLHNPIRYNTILNLNCPVIELVSIHLIAFWSKHYIFSKMEDFAKCAVKKDSFIKDSNKRGNCLRQQKFRKYVRLPNLKHFLCGQKFESKKLLMLKMNILKN